MKAKFPDDVRGRTDRAMTHDVLLKFLCHTTVVVHHAIIELGGEAGFWPGVGKPATSVVLKFRRVRS